MPDGFLADCRAAIGPANVLTLPGDLQRFERDVWHQYEGRAAAVVRPGSAGEVARVVRLAAQHDVALVPQSGNTGLVNGGIPDVSGRQVVLSVEGLDRIRSIDPAGNYIVAEAGCILDRVHEAADAANRLFPLALGSSASCRIGGNVATNAGGLNVLRYGMMRELVLGIEVVLADGTLVGLLKPLRKDNTGYALKQLFIGSEGTLGIVTAASLRLFGKPRERVTMWLAVTAPADAIAIFKALRERFGELLSACELLASDCIDIAAAGLPGARYPLAEPHPWHLLIEVAWSFPDGLRERVESALEAIMAEGLSRDGTIAASEAQRANMWRLREGQSAAASKLGYILRSDVSVDIGRLPEFLHWISSLGPRLSGQGIRVLPFGHVGDGNIHVNYVVPPENNSAALCAMLLDELCDEVDRLGGSISAEHGVGRAKRDAVAARKPARLLAVERRIKSLFDPQNILNPGVMLGGAETSP